MACGSSLKFCRIAEGGIDLYPRFGPTGEWDTAAGQAILEAAGGAVLDPQGRPFRYNQRETLLNGDFIAFGDLALPGTSCGGFNQDFNHQYRGAPAGRGGSFDRVESFQIVFDLALAYGNPAYYNAESKYLPPGVPSDHRVPLGLEAKGKEAERAAKWADLCAHPFKKIGNRFYFQY